VRRTDLPTRDLSQSLNRDADAKFSDLLRRVPGRPMKLISAVSPSRACACLMVTASSAIRL
jgi:hypothetical protein